MTNHSPYICITESTRNGDRTVNAAGRIVAAATRGELYAFLDRKLLDFIDEHVRGAPLGEAMPTASGTRGICLIGTALLITDRTEIERIWCTRSGCTDRAYGADRRHEASTWGGMIEDVLFGWVTSWLTLLAPPARHGAFGAVPDSVFEDLQRAGVCESDWERTRRLMTVGQLRGLVRARHH